MVEHDGTGRDLISRDRRKAAVIAMAPMLVLWLLVFMTHRIPWRVHYDQSLYHEPTVRSFIDQWPAVNLYDYLSATTPGYHLLLAAGSKLFGDSSTGMRIESGIIGIILAGLLGASMASRVKPWIAGILAWPLACSLYIVQSSVYLLPDNLGWLGVCAMVVMALRTSPSALCIGFMGLWLIVVVMARQLHAWTFGLVLVAAWLGNIDAREPFIGPALLRGLGQKIKFLMLAVVSVIPAMFLLYGFIIMWGGPVPPRFATQYSGGFNGASTAFLLSLIAVLGIFQLPVYLPTLVSLWRSSRIALLASVGCGVAAATLTPTSFNYAAGRRSGLWNIAAKLPNIGHTSILILVLSAAGAVIFLALLKPLRARDRLVMSATFAGFCIASAAGVELWQRYTEPFILMFIALLVSMNIGIENEKSNGLPGAKRILAPVIGSLGLSCVFTLMNIAAPFSTNSVSVNDPPPPPKSADDTSPIPAPVDIVPPPPRHGVLPWID